MSLATARIWTEEEVPGEWWAYADFGYGILSAWASTEREALHLLRLIVRLNPDGNDMGDLWIRKLPSGNWTGKTFDDKVVLNAAIGKVHFLDKDYDRVLSMISQIGYTFAYEIEENA